MKNISIDIEENGFFSLDALFAMILLLLVIGTFINLYQGRSEMVEDTRKKLESKMIGEKLAGAINTVYATGKPMTLNIELQENILDEDYTINYDNSSRNAVMRISGNNFTKADVVTNKVQIGNLDPSEDIKIFWENSQIWVKNV